MPRGAFQIRKRYGRSTIHYTHARDENGHKQLCVIAECQSGGTVTVPIWGHAQKSVKKALATLTRECDCPARFHKAVAYEGHKVITPGTEE